MSISIASVLFVLVSLYAVYKLVKQFTPYVGVFIGAGGGGDTILAVLKAMHAQSTWQNPFLSRKVIAVGAGYTYQEYTDNLMKKPNATPAKVERYLRAVLDWTTYKFLDFKNTAVWIEFRSAAVDLFGVEIEDQNNDYYKKTDNAYKSLFQEVIAIQKLNTSIDVYMLPTVKTLSKGRSAFTILQTFIRTLQPTHMYVLDAGGDLVDDKQVEARDRCVALMVRQITRNMPNITVTVNVYGPGCDAHAPVNTVVRRLRFYGGVIDADGSSFAHFLRNTTILSILTTVGLYGDGRATACWLDAVWGTKSLRNYVEQHLMNRPDYKNLADKTFMDASFARLRGFDDLASSYVLNAHCLDRLISPEETALLASFH